MLLDFGLHRPYFSIGSSRCTDFLTRCYQNINNVLHKAIEYAGCPHSEKLIAKRCILGRQCLDNCGHSEIYLLEMRYSRPQAQAAREIALAVSSDEDEDEFKLDGVKKVDAKSAFRGTAKATNPRLSKKGLVRSPQKERRYHDDYDESYLRDDDNDSRREAFENRPSYTVANAMAERKVKPNGKPNYPKEKWVAPAPAVDKRERSLDTDDGYLEDYSNYGKYIIDEKSLFKTKYGEEDDRYFPDILNRNSSESGVARWRSEDEEDEEKEEPDWDMGLVDKSMQIAIVPAEAEEAEDATITSMEMVHFNPMQAKVLAVEDRVPVKTNKVVSFEELDNDGGEAQRQTNEKALGKLTKRFRGTALRRWMMRRPMAGNQKRTSESESLSEEEEFEFDRHGPIERIDEEEQEESPLIEGGSSASYEEAAEYERQLQYQFRKKENARGRPLRPMYPVYYSDDEEDKAAAALNVEQKSFPKGTNKPQWRGLISRFFVVQEPEPLPWEEGEDTNGSKRFLMRSFYKEKRRSVEDLPFPKSESFDNSLVGIDRYRLDGLPQLRPKYASGTSPSSSRVANKFAAPARPKRGSRKTKKKKGSVRKSRPVLS